MGTRFYKNTIKRAWPKVKGARLQIKTERLNLRKSATAFTAESYGERNCDLRGRRIQEKF